MTIQRMEHVDIVVDDLAAAIEFFVELGLELQGGGSVGEGLGFGSSRHAGSVMQVAQAYAADAG